MAKLFYTMDETMERLGITEAQIQELIASSKLMDFRDRDKLMFKVDQVDQLANEQQTTPPPQPGTGPNGLSEDDVMFLLQELTGAPTVFGVLLAPRTEGALFVFAGKKPETAMDPGWEKACSVVAARIPNPMVQLLANLLSTEQAGEEGCDLPQFKQLDRAVFLLANAYTDGKDLKDEELQSLIEAIISLSVMIQVNILVKTASREWIKSTLNPDRDPMDVITQINEASLDFDGSLALVNEGVEGDIRTQRLQKIASKLAA
jgi:hypothetical protein